MRIFIVGPAASGKTTIGKKLAKFLKVDFFDTDEKIEEKFNSLGADITRLN